jgi:hypothetical protein
MHFKSPLRFREHWLYTHPPTIAELAAPNKSLICSDSW